MLSPTSFILFYIYFLIYVCVCVHARARVLLYQVGSRTKYNLYSVNYYDRIGLGWALWVFVAIQATHTGPLQQFA